MIAAEDLSPAELAALLAFHAEAGVEWLLEENPVDRLAEFEAARSVRQASGSVPPAIAAPVTARAEQSAAPLGADRIATKRGPAIPDNEAVQLAKFAAESAGSLAELKAALENFEGCNLKRSAKTTIFATGNVSSKVMIIGSAPSADDDREGIPFAGRCGELLDRMLGAIGLKRDDILLTQAIAWRPPGNRSPSPAEAEICRPFVDRQIALADPSIVLLLGNFAARLFLGDSESIHGLRGRWHDLAVDGLAVPAMATMHPQDLLSAPLNKRLVWRDLQAFEDRITSLGLPQK